MSRLFHDVGLDWLEQEVQCLSDNIERLSPVEFNEKYRVLPSSVTGDPGLISFDDFPFMREPLNCASPESPIREVWLMKGVQIGWTTLLESMLLYYMVHIKNDPILFVSTDKEMIKARMDNNIIPMMQASGFGGYFQTADIGNSRKTGQTDEYVQWPGAYMIPTGAQNAGKFRSYSMKIGAKDELDSWPIKVGKDGCPDALSDGRFSAYWDVRKVMGGSTPTLKHISKILPRYYSGDKRKYFVTCQKCGFEQVLRWHGVNDQTGEVYGIKWDYKAGTKTIDKESVRYHCQNCGHAYLEHDKTTLFDPDNGAEWVPTSDPVSHDVRSYHLSALYSPPGFQPWHKCVTEYLKGYDDHDKKVKDVDKYQVFYNNILGRPFEHIGQKVRFEAVSGHRRRRFRYGEVPNKFAMEFCGSPILFLTCQIDVQDSFLAVAVEGWTKGGRNFLVYYDHLKPVEGEDKPCYDLTCSVWNTVDTIIEDSQFQGDDGREYGVSSTFIDAAYQTEAIVSYCGRFVSGVFPITGRDANAKGQLTAEFTPFTSKSGVHGYRIVVDHYKNRLSAALRREWFEEMGMQPVNHFNAPVDCQDNHLRELTRETLRKKTDTSGREYYSWYRPPHARNELWDVKVYGLAMVDIMAYHMCVDDYGMEYIDWEFFWTKKEEELDAVT